MSRTVPAREFRSHLSELLDEVAERREHVTITRHGRPEAVVIPVDEYDALEETAEILADPDTVNAIRVGLDEIHAVDLVEREPRAGHGLRGRLEGLWMLRVGVYRIIYETRDDVVRVAAIRHRAEAYRSDPRWHRGE